MVRNQGRVTRFVVMAMLQAARARSLGLPEPASFSWGLNRAIFLAAAKRGFRGGGPPDSGGGSGTERPARELYRLGDDEAMRSPRHSETVFTIGDKDQTAEEFERAVEARFGTRENFRQAWEQALSIVGGFDRAVLESRRRFYEEVYRPRRDQLSDEWTRTYSPPAAAHR